MPGYSPRADVAARRAEILRLRIEHRPYREIAAQLQIAESTARNDYRRALDAYAAEQRATAHLAVDREVAKLDQAEEAVWEVLRRRHYTVSNGKLIYLGDEPLEDDAPVLAAVDRLVKIAARRAALKGYDAPARIEVNGARAAEITRLAAELGLAAGVADVDAEGAGAAPADPAAGQG